MRAPDPLRLIVVAVIVAVIAIRVHYWIDGDRREMTLIEGTSSIAGRVVDAAGAAMPGVRVEASATVWRSRGGATTDADGRYQIDRLARGVFTVEASAQGHLRATFGEVEPGIGRAVIVLDEGQHRDGVTITMWRGGTIAGTVYDADGRPVSGCPVQAIETEIEPLRSGTPRRRSLAPKMPVGATDAQGRFRFTEVVPDRYIVSSGCDRNPMVRAYHPAATRVGDATVIVLGPGDARTGIDVRATHTPTSTIAGTIAGPGGAPVIAQVSLTTRSLNSLRRTKTAASAPDGTFSFSGVPADDYVVAAHASNQAGYLWAMATTATDGRRPQTITLELSPGRTLTTRVTVVDMAQSSAPIYETQIGLDAGDDLSTVWRAFLVQKHQLDGHYPSATEGSVPDSFVMNGIPPGRFFLFVSPPRPTWLVDSATLDETDWLDRPGEILRGRDQSATVTFTESGAQISGRLTGQSTKPGPRAVALFAAEPSLRTRPSRARLTRVLDDGTFWFTDLPGGTYLIAGTSPGTPKAWFTPGFYDQLAPAAVSVTVGRGERKTVDLTVR